MKRILILIVSLFLLCSCNSANSRTDLEEKYVNLVESLSEHTEFTTFSNHFTITTDISQINDSSYRYFVIVDNPRVAMYGVEIVAVEKGINYTNNMAANVGVLSETSYNLIPGQVRVDKGYVAGLTVSGVSASSSPVIDVLVQWHSKDQNVVQEFFEFQINIDEAENG